MTAQLLYEKLDRIALLTLNRPDHANSITLELHLAFQQRFSEAAADPDVRALVITGAGRHFCAGADLAMLDDIGASGEIAAELAPDTYLTPLRFPKPLIAALNGSVAGLGFAYAAMCDLRFASEKTVFTTSFSRLGLIAENGLSWLLPQIVGRGNALDLLLSARRVDSDEALRIGLVNRVLPSDELLPQALAYAAELAENCSPASLRAIKQQIDRHASTDLGVATRESALLVAEALRGADLAEGLAAFGEKRSPRFAPLGEGTILTELRSGLADPAVG